MPMKYVRAKIRARALGSEKPGPGRRRDVQVRTQEVVRMDRERSTEATCTECTVIRIY